MLQNHMFPVYFGMQSALPVVIALTYPGLRTVVHNVSPGIAGVLDETVRKNTLVPLATIFVTGVANLFCLMPKAKAIKAQRLQLGSFALSAFFLGLYRLI